MDYKFFQEDPFLSSHSKIEDDVIKDVKVITKGEAVGHNVFIDDISLSKITELGNSPKSSDIGIAVDSNHSDDVNELIGTLNKFKIKGESVFADFKFFKNAKRVDYFKELSEKAPGQFGLSAHIDGPNEIINNYNFLRPDKLLGVGIVRRPAANSSFFSVGDAIKTQNTNVMNKEKETVDTPVKQSDFEDNVVNLLKTLIDQSKEKELSEIKESKEKNVINEDNFSYKEEYNKLKADVQQLSQKFEALKVSSNTEALEVSSKDKKLESSVDKWRKQFSQVNNN